MIPEIKAEAWELPDYCITIDGFPCGGNQSKREAEVIAEFLKSYWNQICKNQIEKDAKLLEMKSDEILLMVGEITREEILTVKAVLANRAKAIRSQVKEEGK